MFVKQKECRLYSCHKHLDFPACEVKLERPHPTDVGWGFYGLAPVKPR